MNAKKFFVTLIIGIASGYYIGYSKARERFLEAMVRAGISFEKREEDASE